MAKTSEDSVINDSQNDDNMEELSIAMKEALSEQIAKTIAMDIGNKFANYDCSRRSNKLKVDSHRKGPVPIEDCFLVKTTQAATYGTLDSECEELDFEDIRVKNANSTAYNKIRLTSNEKGDSISSCRAMIVYFSKLAKAKDEEELIDLNFVENLLESGADINFPDKHGQTCLHEVARGWHRDVAKFMLEHGADINKGDGWGRTPLHLAAAVDYGEMVEYLIENGADIGRETTTERQTAMHYAAKNNATESLKVMLRLGGRINDRDYKRRTPLFVSAETARAESARFLIEQGAPCGVYDSSGTPLLSLLIAKMPQIAIEAIEQFHLLDRAFRKHYYYLGCLELDPSFLGEKIPAEKKVRKEQKARDKAEKKIIQEETGHKKLSPLKCYARTPLEVIVQYNQLDLIMHPVFQRLLHVKWNLFGKKGSMKLLMINLFYTLIWTILGIMVPRKGEDYYEPIQRRWWRIIMETCGVLLTVYFIFSEITQARSGEKVYNFWRHWKTQHMEKDLVFCHPRWPEEEKYLKAELEQIKSYQRTYFRDPWNIFEWITYVVVLLLILTRILIVSSDHGIAQSVHPRLYVLGLIVIWLRFMRSCRAFRTLGPFIAILGSVIIDTLKFAFLFFEFFIPYTVGFWILFGGSSNSTIMGADSAINWENFNDLTFSVWSMTLMGDFDWDGLVAVDRLMAQILCGTYYALAGVICMNLYIALLSDTFARVYASAQANAVMQQAKMIIMLEQNLSKYHRSKYGHYMQDNCSPQEVYTREDTSHSDDHENDMLDRVCRQITNRIDELNESMKRFRNASSCDVVFPSPKSHQPKEELLHHDPSIIENFIQEQKRHNNEMRYEMNFINTAINDIKWIIKEREQLGSQVNTSRIQNDNLQKSTTFSSRGRSNSIPPNDAALQKMSQNLYRPQSCHYPSLAGLSNEGGYQSRDGSLRSTTKRRRRRKKHEGEVPLLNQENQEEDDSDVLLNESSDKSSPSTISTHRV